MKTPSEEALQCHVSKSGVSAQRDDVRARARCECTRAQRSAARQKMKMPRTMRTAFSS